MSSTATIDRELAHYAPHVRLAILAHRATDEAERLRRQLAAAEMAADAAWRLVHQAWPAEPAADRPLDLEPFTTWAPAMPEADAGDLVLLPLD